MKTIILALALLTPLSLPLDYRAATVERPVERPTVNLPVNLRQRNWIGDENYGSCVWATTMSLLRWEGRDDLAREIGRTCGNGAGPSTHGRVMDKLGIAYAMTDSGDERFLEWALRTRRGAGVACENGAHCVALVYLDSKQACIMDNNDPANYRWMSREDFVTDWRNSGGWAFALLIGPPTAPLAR